MRSIMLKSRVGADFDLHSGGLGGIIGGGGVSDRVPSL